MVKLGLSGIGGSSITALAVSTCGVYARAAETPSGGTVVAGTPGGRVSAAATTIKAAANVGCTLTR